VLEALVRDAIEGIVGAEAMEAVKEEQQRHRETLALVADTGSRMLKNSLGANKWI
jgi:hypothetical protein